tara:strand:+ start:4149 stop:5513 length:1365 start_codon:yes stop_codon:yes gene_type:complete
MNKKKSPYIYIPFLCLIYLSVIFYIKNPFWGLMDDATSIRLGIQFSSQPLLTTSEWLTQNNSQGMFRPFFVTQQYLQYFFYDFSNPFPTYLLNIFLVLLGVYLFSKIFINKDKLVLYYAIYLLWPYTYDWFLMPTLNEKFGLLFFSLGLLLKDKNKNRIPKFILGFLAMLIKLNVIVLIPLAIYKERIQNVKLDLSKGMILGLIIQTFFFFNNPGSYYNTGIFETILQIEFNTIQNLVVLLIIFIAMIDFIFLPNSNQEKLLIICICISIFIAFLMLNLRNSSFGYLGTILIFPISLYLILLVNKVHFINIAKLKNLILIICLVVSNIFFLTPRLERWSDIGNILSLDFNNEAVYFCGEGRLMLNIWDIENRDTQDSFFTTFPDIVSAESYWQGAFSNSFRFIGYPTKEIQRDNISYIIDPFCTESITFFNAIQECTYKSLYANEIRFLESIEC